MTISLTSWLRGLVLLRHPELVRELGRLREERLEWEALRAAYPNTRIHRDASFQGWDPERMKLGFDVAIERGTVFAWAEDASSKGLVDIGEHTWIGEYNNFRLNGDSRIRIGRKCLVSQFCSIVAANHGTRRDADIQDQPHCRRKWNVEIEDDVWLGAGASVMPGVHIGRGAVIAAGSVLTTSVPPYEVWGGAPARKIRERRLE